MTVSATFSFDGKLSVHRLGFGAMRLTGDARKPAREDEQAIAVARRAVELGVEFVDTADAYGLGPTRNYSPRRCRPTRKTC
jgi:pyridoxine 4-dehydrogenase